MAAELRKRGVEFSDDRLFAKNHRTESPLSSNLPKETKQSSSNAWIFVVVVLFYITLFLVSLMAYWTLPTPKTILKGSKDDFIEERARTHLDTITSFGSRPTGSHANEVETVNYILQELHKIQDKAPANGVVIEIDVQRPSGAFSLDFLDGFTSVYRNVTNILARITSRKHYPAKHALLLNGHFDSIPGSPGASDDAVSISTMLEILRSLTESADTINFENAIVFNFNGAEENVLQASHGFITQHPWVDTIRAFVNLEAAGAGGQEMVFQTGPENPWIIKAYAEVAPHPSAQAFGQELFQSGVIPSDTDFRIYRDYGGIPGIDMAYIANGYVYHTCYDTPEAVTPGSIQSAGENILSLVKEIAKSPLLADPGEYRHGAMVYFDFLGLFVVHYPERMGVILNTVTALVALVCIIRRTRWTSGQKYTLTQGAVSLMSSVAYLLLSWLMGFLMPLLVAVLLTVSGQSLTWYCRPYLIFGLFVCPTLIGIGAVHWIKAKCNKAADMSKEKESTFSGNAAAQNESEMFHGTLLLWTLILMATTYYRLASAYLPLLWVICPLLVRGLLWEKCLRHKVSSSSQALLVWMYLLAVAIPVLFSLYLAIIVMDLFVPIMGRGGSEMPPDLFIAIMSAILTNMITSYMTSIVYLLRDLKLPGTVVVLLSTAAIIISLTGLSFPYSRENKCPERIFFQHVSRTFHDTDGRVVKEDSGLWMNSLDYMGIKPIQHIPLLQAAHPASQEGVYGGFPYYLPLRSRVRKPSYLPGPPVDSPKPPVIVKFLSNERHSQLKYKFRFSISGPDHMTVYFSPHEGVVVMASSVGSLIPIPDGNGRTAYFIYYSYGVDPGPWDFWLEFAVNQPVSNKTNLFDLAVAGHYIHGKEATTPFLKTVLQQVPDWVFANPFTNIYKSWSFTTESYPSESSS